MQNRMLWKPVGVLHTPDFCSWGAPLCGDTRLCCKTRYRLYRQASTDMLTRLPQASVDFKHPGSATRVQHLVLPLLT